MLSKDIFGFDLIKGTLLYIVFMNLYKKVYQRYTLKQLMYAGTCIMNSMHIDIS